MKHSLITVTLVAELAACETKNQTTAALAGAAFGATAGNLIAAVRRNRRRGDSRFGSGV